MQQYILDNRDAYEKTADEFQVKKAVRLAADKRISSTFKEYLPDGATVLELGSGSGQLAKLLSESQLKVDVIEYAPKMATLAAQTAPEAHVIVDEFLSHDFGDQKYDGIIGIAFVHLFNEADVQTVMSKINSLLQPGGVLMLATTVHEKTYDDIVRKTNFKTEVTRFRRHYSLPDFQALCESNGFEIHTTTFDGDKEVQGKQWVNIIARKLTH